MFRFCVNYQALAGKKWPRSNLDLENVIQTVSEEKMNKVGHLSTAETERFFFVIKAWLKVRTLFV